MPDSRFNENKPNPLYLVEGKLLTPEKVSGTRYSFQHIPMKDVAVLEYPQGVDIDRNVTSFFPSEYNQAVVFRKINDTTRSPLIDSNGNSSVVADWSEVREKPSGFITPVGTLIPQIIVPWGTSKNRIVFQNPVYQQTVYNDYERISEWVADNRFPGIETYYSSEINTYGLYDSFLNAKDFTSPQDDNFYQRTYQARVSSYVSDMSAFAFLFDIVKVHPNASSENPAYVQMQLSGENADTVVARFYQKGSVIITLYRNGNGTPVTISGSLSFTEMSQKTTQCKSGVIRDKNVVFFYSLLNRLIVTGDLTTNNEQTSKAISLVRNPNLNMMGIADPPVDEFPLKHKEDDRNYIQVNSSDAHVKFGNVMTVTWRNCIGSFSLSKVRFCPRVCFSYFYRMDGTSKGNNDGAGDYSDYFGIEFGGNRSGYEDLGTLSYSRKVYEDKSTQSTIYRADFDILYDMNHMSKHPFEILGLIHIVKRKGPLTKVKDGDGDFGKRFDKNINGLFNVYRKGAKLDNKGESWIDYLTNISVSHTLEGTSGSMTLDKYLMMDDLAERPKQSIGAVTVCGRNIVKYGKRNSSSDPYPSLPDGQFFKGYALETADSQSNGSSDLTIALTGIQTKLSMMSLVNVPYWDGDRFFGKNDSDADAVFNYFKSYTGCDLRYVSQFSLNTASGNDDVDRRTDIILPRSFDYKSPAVHFNMGTSCLEALKELGRLINHQFVVQPDGRGYFYGMDKYGRPVWITKGPVRWTYDESDILSLRLSPYLDNKYNTFLTLGILGTNTHSQEGVIPEGASPGMEFSEVDDDDSYPWAKIITNRENGILTKGQLRNLHKINVNFGRSQMYTGSITVPGRNEFYLFDKVRINHGNGSDVFYIYGITHNINMQTKEWTTELQIADFDI